MYRFIEVDLLYCNVLLLLGLSHAHHDCFGRERHFCPITFCRHSSWKDIMQSVQKVGSSVSNCRPSSDSDCMPNASVARSRIENNCSADIAPQTWSYCEGFVVGDSQLAEDIVVHEHRILRSRLPMRRIFAVANVLEFVIISNSSVTQRTP